MGFSDEPEIYKNPNRPNEQINQKWTLYLFFCVMTVTLASFQFGYNISVMNSPTNILKEFISKESFLFQNVNKSLELNSTEKFQSTPEVDYIWTLVNCLFVVGGMIGAFMSKYILDTLGRKGGILFHYIFSLSGSVLVAISFYSNLPNLLILSRFLFGVQGGMSCSLIPTYLSEISPASLRGQTGVAHQLCLTIGILVAQIFGFKELLGDHSTWHFLLAFPLIPSIFGAVLLSFFFPETPKALINYRKTEAAERALIRLRNRANVNSELQDIFKETSGDTAKKQNVTFGQLFTESRFKWALITSLALQIAQQLCGINAVFFYSEQIFKNAGIAQDNIQYAIFLTGFINFLSTILCTVLIDKLGRRPLLIFPMFLIVVDFVVLTVFLHLKGSLFSSLSIVCIMVFIVCFAVGLGPIPFIYAAECFGQDARGAALSICMFTNWVANFLLTLMFPTMAKILGENVFVVFGVIVLLSLVVIIKKVPETKGISFEEIELKLNGRRTSNSIIMSNIKA